MAKINHSLKSKINVAATFPPKNHHTKNNLIVSSEKVQAAISTPENSQQHIRGPQKTVSCIAGRLIKQSAACQGASENS